MDTPEFGENSETVFVAEPRVVYLNDIELVLMPVHPGAFLMGSRFEGEDHERPQRRVEITRGFWLGKFEVTQAQYEALAGARRFNYPGINHPAENMSWVEAVDFCRILTEQEREAGRLPPGYVFRLPTEAEWEYAARGGFKNWGSQYSGSDTLHRVGWFFVGVTRSSRPVGGKEENQLGLYDMSGNVSEWVHDWYQPNYENLSTVDPVGPESGSRRVIRGGSASSNGEECRVAARRSNFPLRPSVLTGFRVALAPDILEPANR